jgi:ACS family glucarate transporter-like MFS transporter
MNMGGNLGGLISASLTPIVAARFGWVGSLDFSAILASLGGLLWLWLDPGKGPSEETEVKRA